jgi:hypothetical protein
VNSGKLRDLRDGYLERERVGGLRKIATVMRNTRWTRRLENGVVGCEFGEGRKF